MARNNVDAKNADVFVVSTMTNDVSYAFWRHIPSAPGAPGAPPVLERQITIRGGAGLPSIKDGFGEMSKDSAGSPMWTPSGVVTPLKAEAYAALKEHWLFKRHIESGRVSVVNQNISQNHGAVKKVVAGMEKKDHFAQLNAESFKGKVKVSSDKMKSFGDFEDFVSRA